VSNSSYFHQQQKSRYVVLCRTFSFYTRNHVSTIDFTGRRTSTDVELQPFSSLYTSEISSMDTGCSASLDFLQERVVHVPG
jgi:hypothetical protein